jgi:serine phosphatase RsbU (regulator of sigma subunit)
MKNFKEIYLFFVLLFALTFNLAGQIKNIGLPYIVNYSLEDYKIGSKQNWATVEDKRGVLYFGNTSGVLEFDGLNWRLIPLPNLVRALAIDNLGRIYVGSRGDFGFLQPDSIGRMEFVSLLDKVENESDRKFNDAIGRIFISKGTVYFTCEGILFIYREGKVSVKKIPKLKQAFESQERVFVRIDGEGIAELINGEIKLIPNSNLSKNLAIRSILPYDDKFMIVTNEDGLFLYDSNSITKLKFDIDNFLVKEKVLSAIALKGGYYAFGFNSSGLMIIDKQGNVIQYLHTSNGLQSGQVSGLMQDSQNNLWLCTTNGITSVLSGLPLSIFSSIYNLNSTCSGAVVIDDMLYTATGTGMFVKNWNRFENHLQGQEVFKQIGETGNLLGIDTIGNTLVAATNIGISIVQQGKLADISLNDRLPVLKFLRVGGYPNLMLAGTGKGLLLLEDLNQKTTASKTTKLSSKLKPKNQLSKPSKPANWAFKSRVKGFSERSRHIVMDSLNNVWFSDKQKGVAKLVPVNNFDSVATFWYNENKGLPVDVDKYVYYIKGEIIISSEQGFFVYNPRNDNFIESTKWNKILGKDGLISILTEDSRGNIWFKEFRNLKQGSEGVYELGQLVPQQNGEYNLYKTPFYKFKNNIHSISPQLDGTLIVGTDKGFLHYDPKIQKDYHKTYHALIRKVEFVKNDSLIFGGAFADSTGIVSLGQKSSDIFRIPFNFNNLRFTFAAPYMDAPEQVLFKYYLEGNDEGWSDWKAETFKEYSNLPQGSYVFRVVAKNIYEIESSEAVYYFTILPPWYQTFWAYIFYFVATIFGIWGIVRLSVRRLRMQKEHLERVVDERTAEIRLKNAELEQQKEEILAQRDEIEVQKDKIEEKNKNITASITYAKRIQEAMLPLVEKIDQVFDDYFILFKPRDIVSGDFYWFQTRNNKIIFTAVDCTGHGVPGAFMSMIGSEILTTIVNQGITTPAEILDYMNRYVRKALKQDQTDNQDGMDMSLCTIDKQQKIVEWSGAKNPLVYIQNKEMFHIKGDAQSIGGHQLSKKERQFANNIISYESGPTYFYIFTDGYQDQFGGQKGRKFMIKGMKELIYENHLKPMKEQHKILDSAIEEWKSGVEQTDDILVIGFKLTP